MRPHVLRKVSRSPTPIFLMSPNTQAIRDLLESLQSSFSGLPLDTPRQGLEDLDALQSGGTAAEAEITAAVVDLAQALVVTCAALPLNSGPEAAQAGESVLQAALDLVTAREEECPDAVVLMEVRALCLMRLSIIAFVFGGPETEADRRELLGEVVATRRDLARAEPESPDRKHHLAHALTDQGEALVGGQSQPDRETALAVLQEAANLLRFIADERAEDLASLRLTSRVRFQLANLMVDSESEHDWRLARPHWEEAHRVGRRRIERGEEAPGESLTTFVTALLKPCADAQQGRACFSNAECVALLEEARSLIAGQGKEDDLEPHLMALHMTAEALSRHLTEDT